MKKTIAVLMGLLIGSQAFADPWHGSRHSYRQSYHGGPVYNYHNYYNTPRGEWRHTNHNGQLAWWFVVGSMFYLSEQAYLNDRRQETIIVNPPTVYNSPRYIEQPVYTAPSYRPSYGWYCEPTGRFSNGSYDTCPSPWVSRPY